MDILYDIPFGIAALVAVGASVATVTRAHAVHALLYLVVSLMAVAVIFYMLGAPFVAGLEVIIYAGAIVVLFIFAAMMIDLGAAGVARERGWLSPRAFLLPVLLGLVLGVEMLFVLAAGRVQAVEPHRFVEPSEVGAALLGPYVIGVEISSMLLLAGLVGALHIGRRRRAAGSGDGSGTAREGRADAEQAADGAPGAIKGGHR